MANESDAINEALQTVADLLEVARRIVAALETAATAETIADISAGISEAREDAELLLES